MSSAPTQALWGVRREVLVPLSLDIDIDGVRVVDTFTWDCHQSEVRFSSAHPASIQHLHSTYVRNKSVSYPRVIGLSAVYV